MAQITTEDKKRLKQLVNQLEEVNNQLRIIYLKMMRSMLCSFLYIFAWGTLLVICQHYITSFSLAIWIFSACCLMYVILTLYFHLLIKPTNKRYKQVYRRGLILLGTLINYVDWEVFRKRQLYNENDARVENVIEGFLKYARKNVSPTNSKNKTFYVLLVVQIVLRNGIYLFSVIAFFEQIREYLY